MICLRCYGRMIKGVYPTEVFEEDEHVKIIVGITGVSYTTVYVCPDCGAQVKK